MFVDVLLALRGAGVTNIGTNPAQVFREMIVAAQQRGSGPAEGCAVPIQPDALRELMDVRLNEAGVGTTLTRLRTTDAGVDTGLGVSVIGIHNGLPGTGIPAFVDEGITKKAL